MAVTQSYYYDTALGQAETQGWNPLILCHHCFFPHYKWKELPTGLRTHGNGRTDVKTALCFSRGQGRYGSTDPFWPSGSAEAQEEVPEISVQMDKCFPKCSSSTIDYRNAALNKQIELWCIGDTTTLKVPWQHLLQRLLILIKFSAGGQPSQDCTKKWKPNH